MLFKLALTLLCAATDRGTPLGAALALEERGDTVAAQAALERLVREQPSWELPRLEAARLLLKEGQGLDRVEWHLEAARSLAPENPRGHFLWALLQDERRRPDAAMEALRTALLLRSDYHDARFRLAGLYQAAGRYAEAASEWRRYAEDHPDQAGPRLQLAAALERAGKSKEAERELRRLFESPRTREIGGRRLAEYYDRTRRPAEAAKVRAAIDPPVRKLRDLKPSRR